jgi:hypothetical protein
MDLEMCHSEGKHAIAVGIAHAYVCSRVEDVGTDDAK